MDSVFNCPTNKLIKHRDSEMPTYNVNANINAFTIMFCYLYESFRRQSNILIVTAVIHHRPPSIHLCPCKTKTNTYVY